MKKQNKARQRDVSLGKDMANMASGKTGKPNKQDKQNKKSREDQANEHELGNKLQRNEPSGL